MFVTGVEAVLGAMAAISGATASTLLIAQFLKISLDYVWKIPTKAFVYIIALVIMAAATAFTSELAPNSFLQCILKKTTPLGGTSP